MDPTCPSPALDPDRPRWLRWSVHEDVQALAFAGAMVAAAAGGMLGRGRLPRAGAGLAGWSQGAQLDVAVTLAGGATFVWLLQRLRGACTDRWWPSAAVTATLAVSALSLGGPWVAGALAAGAGTLGGLLWPRPVARSGGLHGAALARVAATWTLWLAVWGGGSVWSGAALWGGAGAATPMALAALAGVVVLAGLSEARFGARRWPVTWALAVVAIAALPWIGGLVEGSSAPPDALRMSPRTRDALRAASLLWGAMAAARLGLELGSTLRARATGASAPAT